MNESALQFGPDRNLVGLLTEAVGTAKPVVPLLLNAGVIHRIGPHRINVKLARHLAEQGFMSLRFDLAGVGDSRAPKGASDYRQQAVLDVQAAMDLIESKYGPRSFAVFGICSGAANAYAAALADERVAGVFMIDGYVYATLKGQLYRAAALLKAYGPAGILAKTVGRVRRLLSKAPGTAEQPPADLEPVYHPTREQFANEIDRLVDRGVCVAMMQSASILEKYGYAEQLRDTFRGRRFVDRVICHHTMDINHTVTPLSAQGRLCDIVTDWVQKVTPRPVDIVAGRPAQ